jgi:hypothetical protein
MDNHSSQSTLFLLVLFLFLSSCGGTKLIKAKHIENTDLQPLLISIRDENVEVSLYWILVNKGPKSWAKRSYWDEYILQVKNLSNQDIRITNIHLIDFLNTAVFPQENRSDLKSESKKVVRRFKKAGIKIKYGTNSKVLLNSFAGVTIVAGASISAAGPVALVSATGTGIAAAAIVATPLMAIGGIMRMVNNSKVNNEIQKRKSTLPLDVPAMNQQIVDLFFPVSPAVQQIVISYSIGIEEHQLRLDIKQQTENLHIVK